MRTQNNTLPFDHLIIDSTLAPILVKEGFFPFLEQFAQNYHVHTIGRSEFLTRLVKGSNGQEFAESLLPTVDSVWESLHSASAAYRYLANELKIPPREMRNRVLHLKSTKNQRVLRNRFEGKAHEERQKEIVSRSCHLHLIAYGIETCSFGCIYCFADYNHIQPTTVLFDCPERVRMDLQEAEIRELILRGTPIYLGSLADMCSHESIFFQIPQRMLDSLAGLRVFTVTKSPLIALPVMVDALRNHGAAKVVFTFSNLVGFERNLPYDAKVFPSDTLRKLADQGIDTVLLYKPVVPGINDRRKQVLRVLQQAADSGVKEASMGFMQMDPEMEEALSQLHEPQYKYFDRVLVDTIRDERIPPMQHRQRTVRMFADVCAQLGLRLSFCQAYVGAVETELASSYCVCRPDRWLV